MQTIENEKLRVQVADHGAELSSIYDKENDREIVWIADPAYWNRHAPVLFPFVGKVNGGYYTQNGVNYKMGQHGFARDMDFTLVQADESKIVYRLVSDETTKQKYPFDFALTITHTLCGNQVEVTWEVENTGNDVLHFSIGGHPAFNIPEKYRLLHGEPAEQGYEILFNEGMDGYKNDGLEYVLIDPATEGVDAEHPRKLNTEKGKIRFTRHLFDQDALIFDNGQIGRVSILLDGQPYVTLTCPGFPSFGVWSKPKADAPYVCLEPWIGRCDNVGFRGELSEKYGEQHLPKGESFKASYTITIG